MHHLTSGTGYMAKADPVFFKPATKEDVEDHFSKEGTGKITEIKLMNGFGFIEYENALDARDIVPSKNHISYCDQLMTDFFFSRFPYILLSLPDSPT